ncbi:MAG: chemotaxis protein CheW [Acidobacteria bacterium]|nr:chemotaxis protein CheW [Acidobacteriota bacterium]
MQYVTFQVGDLICGADVNCVQEVLRHQNLTPVPLALPVTPGLIHLRGQILTAIDLGSVFELDRSGEPSQKDCVIVHQGEEAASLLVDRIGEVLDVADCDVQTPPSHWNGALRGYLRGVVDHSNRLLLLLDAPKLLAVQGGPDTGFDEVKDL